MDREARSRAAYRVSGPMTEIGTPLAPGANKARLFVRDVSGSTQLCVKFADGKLKTIATDL